MDLIWSSYYCYCILQYMYLNFLGVLPVRTDHSILSVNWNYLYLYLYISISREIQDAKGREALIWILPHHTYVAEVNTWILCELRFLHLWNQRPTRESNRDCFCGRQARYQLLHEAHLLWNNNAKYMLLSLICSSH